MKQHPGMAMCSLHHRILIADDSMAANTWRCPACTDSSDPRLDGPTPGPWMAAVAETNRLQRELDITNADHIALWLEANTIPDEPMSQCISWLAVQIVEAHERAIGSRVDQCDRDAAADFGGWEEFRTGGFDDHKLVQAFARHRQSAITRARGKDHA